MMDVSGAQLNLSKKKRSLLALHSLIKYERAKSKVRSMVLLPHLLLDNHQANSELFIMLIRGSVT